MVNDHKWSKKYKAPSKILKQEKVFLLNFNIFPPFLNSIFMSLLLLSNKQQGGAFRGFDISMPVRDFFRNNLVSYQGIRYPLRGLKKWLYSILLESLSLSALSFIY